MKTAFRGIYTVEEFFQALFEEREKFREQAWDQIYSRREPLLHTG